VVLVKTRKVGGSFVVTLPKKLVEAKRIREGEIIDIDISKVRKDGFGVLKGMKPFAVEDELTPSEKVNVAIDMTDLCVRICADGIRDQNPGITDEELMERLRERFMFAKRHRSRV
jgi:bifunctional DNA-binding transcriptional regulator/antitoxin component of YhaV-PrlF toxin-antitoxin module